MLSIPATTIHAVLLDRDGVINRERKDYVKRWEEFEFLPGALLALQMLAKYSWPIVVITNQSAINRQIASQNEIQEIHRKFTEAVNAAGGRIDAIFVCPHRPDELCCCRKPEPGLLIQAAQQFQVALEQCIFIGDSITDHQAAAAVNCPAILVNQGNDNTYKRSGGGLLIPVVADLLAAVTMITATEVQAKVEG